MHNKDQKRREKILNGNLWQIVLAICLPLFIYQLFNSFYNLIDTIFANKISTSSVSSVAALGQVKNLLSSFGAGMSAGGGILIARRFGGNDIEEARKFSNATFSLVFVVSIIIALICIPLAFPICNSSGISSSQASAATGYFTVQMIEVAVVALNCVFIAIEKAKGNTRSIFYLNLITMGVKLFFNYLFIFIIGVDNIIYIAIATLISQLVLFFILGFFATSKKNIFRLSFKYLTLKWKYIGPILKISIPIFIGKFVFSFGKVAVNSIFGEGYKEILLSKIDINDANQVKQAEASAGLVVGALAVSNSINGIATSPIGTFEETESTIISQNLGNNNPKRAWKTFIVTFTYCFILGTIGYILIRFVFQSALIGLFNNKDYSIEQSKEFMAYVKQINKYDSISIPSLAINSAVIGVLYGFGKTKLAAGINIARAFVFRIPSLIILLKFYPELGVDCVGLSMAISNIGIALMSITSLIIFYIGLKKKDLNNIDEKNKEGVAE